MLTSSHFIHSIHIFTANIARCIDWNAVEWMEKLSRERQETKSEAQQTGYWVFLFRYCWCTALGQGEGEAAQCGYKKLKSWMNFLILNVRKKRFSTLLEYLSVSSSSLVTSLFRLHVRCLRDLFSITEMWRRAVRIQNIIIFNCDFVSLCKASEWLFLERHGGIRGNYNFLHILTSDAVAAQLQYAQMAREKRALHLMAVVMLRDARRVHECKQTDTHFSRSEINKMQHIFF